MLAPSQVTPHSPQHFVAGTHLYSWVKRGTLRVKYLAQEHDTASDPGQGSNPDRTVQSPARDHTTFPFHFIIIVNNGNETIKRKITFASLIF